MEIIRKGRKISRYCKRGCKDRSIGIIYEESVREFREEKVFVFRVAFIEVGCSRRFLCRVILVDSIV